MPTVTLSLKWFDAENKSITEQVYYDIADVSTVADAQAEFNTLQALLEAVSGCIIGEASVTFQLTNTSTEEADQGYYRDSGATLSFKDSNNVGQSLFIPGILMANMVDGTDLVDPSAAGIEALTDKITGQGGVDPLSTRNTAAAWVEFVGGKKSRRKPN